MSSAWARKSIFITGAASGIGRATAKALADAGATVSLLDVNDELGPGAAEEAGAEVVGYARFKVGSDVQA